LEVTAHDTQASSLHNLSAEDIEFSEQLQKALKDFVDEGHCRRSSFGRRI